MATHMQNKVRVSANNPNTYDHSEVITCSGKAVGKIQQKNISMKHILKKKHWVRLGVINLKITENELLFNNLLFTGGFSGNNKFTSDHGYAAATKCINN